MDGEGASHLFCMMADGEGGGVAIRCCFKKEGEEFPELGITTVNNLLENTSIMLSLLYILE